MNVIADLFIAGVLAALLVALAGWVAFALVLMVNLMPSKEDFEEMRKEMIKESKRRWKK